MSRSKAAGGGNKARGYLRATADATVVSLNRRAPPRGSRALAATEGAPARCGLGHSPFYCWPPSEQQQQVMRQLGSRDGQVVCLPLATAVCGSCPLPPKGARNWDKRNRKRCAGRHHTRVRKEKGKRSGSLEEQAKGKWARRRPNSRQQDSRDARVPSSRLADGLREPAVRLTSGYQETLSCFCRDNHLPRGAETPNFRRWRRRLARQMGVTCDCLGRACATLFFNPNRFDWRTLKKMAATLAACHAVFHPGWGRRGRRGKASQRPS